jgi:hypothetical protein
MNSTWYTLLKIGVPQEALMRLIRYWNLPPITYEEGKLLALKGQVAQNKHVTVMKR